MFLATVKPFWKNNIFAAMFLAVKSTRMYMGTWKCLDPYKGLKLLLIPQNNGNSHNDLVYWTVNMYSGINAKYPI